MTRLQNYCEVSPQQAEAVKAADKIYEKMCNQSQFSMDDIKHIQADIKAVHKMCRESFGGPMFTWQADNYQLQMFLENENRITFVQDQTLTWTRERWRKAVVRELAIHFYRHSDMMLYDFQFRFMCCWLLFQYFNTSVLSGRHCKEIIGLGVEIFESSQDEIEKAKSEIRQWRADNDDLIRRINRNKSFWRNEKGRCRRLVYGWLKSSEVELHHMVVACRPELSYDINIKLVANKWGLSERAARKRGKEIGFTSDTFLGIMLIYYDELKKEYDKEYKYAERLLRNSLTKKERREFWRRHQIYNRRIVFRTFISELPDLIPADNPLETSDNQQREIPKDEVLFGNVFLSPPLAVIPPLPSPQSRLWR